MAPTSTRLDLRFGNNGHAAPWNSDGSKQERSRLGVDAGPCGLEDDTVSSWQRRFTAVASRKFFVTRAELGRGFTEDEAKPGADRFAGQPLAQLLRRRRRHHHAGAIAQHGEERAVGLLQRDANGVGIHHGDAGHQVDLVKAR